MKYFLLILTTSVFNVLSAQSDNIIIKAQKQSLSASIDTDNSDKTFILNTNTKSLKTDKLVIYNGHYKDEKDWKRSFTIADDADAEILRLTVPTKEKYFQISLREVQTKLKKDKEYSLYTIAIPKDSKKAAIVRVRRILICKIRVK